MVKNYAKIERVRKLIDRVAYFSLVLDICIAVLTSVSIFHLGNPEAFLVPVNYMLTAVVVLSIGMFVTLFYLKHEENILDALLSRKYRFSSIQPLKYKIDNKITYYKNKRV